MSMQSHASQSYAAPAASRPWPSFHNWRRATVPVARNEYFERPLRGDAEFEESGTY